MASEIMGSSTTMGKVDPSKHWIKRKKLQKKKCGTKIDPPPNDVWYQCSQCYVRTIIELKLIKPISEPQNKRIYLGERPAFHKYSPVDHHAVFDGKQAYHLHVNDTERLFIEVIKLD